MKDGLTFIPAFTSGLANMIPMLKVAGVVGAAALAVWAFDKTQTGWTRAQEASEIASQKYDESQSKVESLQSQQAENLAQAKEIAIKYNIEVSGADTVQDVIDKVESSDTTLNFVDEAELSRLSQASTQLESQLKIQEQLAKSQKEVAKVQNEQAAQASKSYWEYKKEQHGGGLFGTAAALWDWATSQKPIYDEVTGRYTGKDEADVWAEGGTTNIDLARKSLEKLKGLKEEQRILDDKIANQQGKITEDQIKQRENLNSQIADTTAETANYLDVVNQQADKFREYGDNSEYAQQFVSDTDNMMKELRQMDMTPAEKALDSLQTFFDGSKGKNAIKDYLQQSTAEGKTLKRALSEIGLTIDDLGIENMKQLRDYLDGSTKKADEASKSVDSFRKTVEDVDEASKSADQDVGWSTIQSAVKKGKELLEEGKTGTDDFQTIAQFLSPKNLKKEAQAAKEAGGYAADVYQEAFEQNLARAERWFGDDETQSMMNAVDDFADAGLFKVDKSDEKGLWDIDSQFKSTAEAADKLGVSVGAVETILDGLEAYGYDFSGIEKSGDMIENFTDQLDGLKSVYDSMENGKGKDHVKDILDTYDTGYQSLEEDLSQLTEEQVVHIRFEYDLASIQSQIDALQNQKEGEIGGGSAETNASLIASQSQYINKSMDMLQQSGNKLEIPASIKADMASIDDFKSKLANTTDEAVGKNLQDQIIGKQQNVMDWLNGQDQQQLANMFGNAAQQGTEQGMTQGAQQASEKVGEIQKTATKDAQESAFQEMSTSAASIMNPKLDPETLSQFQQEMTSMAGESEIEVEAKLKASEIDSDGVSGDGVTVEGGKIEASEIEAPEGDAIELNASVNTSQAEGELSSLSGQEIEASVSADTSTVEDAMGSLSGQQVEVSMNVDTSEAEGATDSLEGQEVEVGMNVDTSGADGALSSLQGQTVNVPVNADVSAATGAISGLSGQAINVSVNVDAPEAPEYPDQTPQVTYGINAPPPPVYPDQNPQVNYHINAPAPPSYPNISRTVTYHIVTVGSPPAVDGTAHAMGTAKARGDWGTKNSGVALGGELGRKHFASIHSDMYLAYI